ncbi:MAG: caspase family protein [Saprospiraceae bacterium]|nr:caspase family protein [Saprospiraceae bacterium]
MSNFNFKIIFISLFYSSFLIAQSKGVISIPDDKLGHKNSTYAVLVGISDYQNSEIPDLKFADKDAQAFYQYIKSKAGGSIEDSHIKLLINEQATMAQFAVALDWLWEVCKPGDQAIIYFSGHGDVERRSLTQPGFLLCWDSPANVYMSGGAFSLFMLQEIISTLSLKNQTQTIAIIDACRSGKLAGSSIHGSQLTNTNLAKQYANEIKILSCQPDEYSMEGEQWGGGRGAFSFHLVKGLYGLADENEDLEVNSYEISRYLEDRVKKDVAPIRQIPMVIGSRDYTLSKVFKKELDSINSIKTYDQVLFSGIDHRSIDYMVENITDPLLYETYQNFKKSLIEKRYLAPKANCAEFYYSQLLASDKLKSLQSTFTRNYAAALQDEAQQFMNSMLLTDVKEISRSKKVRIERCLQIIEMIERSKRLLGKKHYLYPIFEARLNFFKAFIEIYKNQNGVLENGIQAKKLLSDAIETQAEMPLYYYTMGLNHAFHLKDKDSMIYYFETAMKLSPNWTLPRVMLPFLVYIKFGDKVIAERYFKMAIEKDSNSATVNVALGLYYNELKYPELAKKYFLKAHSLDTGYIDPIINLANHAFEQNEIDEAGKWARKGLLIDSTNALLPYLLGKVFIARSNYKAAEHYLKRAIELDSTAIEPYSILGNMYLNLGFLKKAEEIFNRAIAIDSLYPNLTLNLGTLHYLLKKYSVAEHYYLLTIQNLPEDFRSYYNIACMKSLTGDVDSAFKYLEEAIRRKAPKNDILSDGDLENVRKLETRWSNFISKHFP